MNHRRLLRRRPSRKIGVAPGTLVHVGEASQQAVTLDRISYDGSSIKQKNFALNSIVECCNVKASPTISWINIDGIHVVAHIETIGRQLGLHPLVLEDIVNSDHRPKMEDYKDYLFLVLKIPSYKKELGLRTEQLSLVLGKNYVVSFQETPGHIFDSIRLRLQKDDSRLRMMGADYLAYTLIDAVVDHYFVVIESISDEIEELEQLLFSNPDTKILQSIHEFKREMILLRKSVWPLRELIASLQRGESQLISEPTRMYLRDVYDHTIQIVDTLETFRDMISGMLDLYLSTTSHRMNEVMKVLTMMATIFIPLTFIAGIYGMNFEYMPELRWRWGYFGLWGFMIAVAGGMFAFFRVKRWL